MLPVRLRALAVVAACALLGSGGVLATSGSGADPVTVAISTARAQLGEAYAWGGSGPDTWDCSGLEQTAWRAAGVADVPRTSQEQAAWAWSLPAAQAVPGDLVFYGTPVNHVGIYLGNGRMVDASASGSVVKERALWASPSLRFGRVPRPGAVRPVAGATSRWGAKPWDRRSARARAAVRPPGASATPAPAPSAPSSG